MFYIKRTEIKDDIRKAIDDNDLKTVMQLSYLLGISKTKLLQFANVDPSNYYKFLNTGTGVSSEKKQKIYRVVKELFLC